MSCWSTVYDGVVLCCFRYFSLRITIFIFKFSFIFVPFLSVSSSSWSFFFPSLAFLLTFSPLTVMWFLLSPSIFLITPFYPSLHPVLLLPQWVLQWSCWSVRLSAGSTMIWTRSTSPATCSKCVARRKYCRSKYRNTQDVDDMCLQNHRAFTHRRMYWKNVPEHLMGSSLDLISFHL